jgi:hypothetical protein
MVDVESWHTDELNSVGAPCSVATDLVDCLKTTGEPHEYFDPTANNLILGKHSRSSYAEPTLTAIPL